MKSRRDYGCIQEFIDYKLANQADVEMQAKIFSLRRKYQNSLNSLQSQVNRAIVSLQNKHYQHKKFRKQAWNRQLELSNAKKEIESAIYKYSNNIRMIQEQRDSELRELDLQNRQRLNLEKKIAARLNDVQGEVFQSLQEQRNKIGELLGQNQELKAQIQEKEFSTKQYIQMDSLLQKLKSNIGQLEQRCQAAKEQNEKNQILLIHLSKKAQQALLTRKQEQKITTRDKKQEITKYIQKVRQMLQNENNQEVLLSQIRNILTCQKDGFDSNEFNLYKQKLEQISDAMKLDKEEKNCIDQSISQIFKAKIEDMKAKIQEIDSQKEQTLILEAMLAQKQQSKDKQIRNINQTLTRMQSNIKKS